MDRRHRSASRSRRERSSTSLRSSHESSMAGNLSPGRHHGQRSRRREGGGGFFKNLFGGRRDTREQSPPPMPQQQQQHMQHPHLDAGPAPVPQGSPSPASKFRALLSFAPGRQGRSPPTNIPGLPQPVPSPVPYAGRTAEELPGKGMQHTFETMQDSYMTMETRLTAEQRAATEWKEKWNYQNFKLNLMVDMLVLRVLELEQPTAGSPGR